MMTDMANINESSLKVMYWLLIGIFTFNLKVSQGHAHFGCEYLVNGDR